MNKNVFLILSGIVNVILIIILAITLSKLWQTQDNLKTANFELQQTKNQINNIISENKQLLSKASEFDKELISVKNKLANTQKQLAEPEANEHLSSNISSPLKSIAEQFMEALSTGQSMDVKASKAREFGKLCVKRNKTLVNGGSISDQEILREYSEMLKLIADIGLKEEMRNDLLLLTKPETRQLLTNVVAGMFEELGKPMSKSQITQYEATLDKIGEISRKITNENQTPTERMIAYLQNSDTITPLIAELSAIFTSEQKEVGEKTSTVFADIKDFISSQANGVGSSVNVDVRDKNELSKYVLNSWSNSVGASPELKNSLKPIAEQYVKDYVSLRKNMELAYDKNIMDYYLERNKPDDATKEDEYYREREKIFQTNPDYIKAKIALDIEFLQLRNRYYKEVAKTVGDEKNAIFINSFPHIYHYPNVN
jgi:uncharacterized protein YoxC